MCRVRPLASGGIRAPPSKVKWLSAIQSMKARSSSMSCARGGCAASVSRAALSRASMGFQSRTAAAPAVKASSSFAVSAARASPATGSMRKAMTLSLRSPLSSMGWKTARICAPPAIAAASAESNRKGRSSFTATSRLTSGPLASVTREASAPSAQVSACAVCAAKAMSAAERPLVSAPAVKASKKACMVAGICARACASASNCSILVMVRPGFAGASNQAGAPFL